LYQNYGSSLVAEEGLDSHDLRVIFPLESRLAVPKAYRRSLVAVTFDRCGTRTVPSSATGSGTAPMSLT